MFFLWIDFLFPHRAFTGSAVHFSFLVLKIWLNFGFSYYVDNFTLVGSIRFTCTIYFFSLIISLIYIYIDNWFDIFTAAITDFHIISVEYLMVFTVVEKIFWINWRKYLPMLLQIFFEKGGLIQMMFLVRFVDDLYLFPFWLIGGLYWSLYNHTQIGLGSFDRV